MGNQALVQQQNQMRKHLIGSISHGTMREEDLIPAFLDAIAHYSKSRGKALRKEADTLQEEDLSEFLNETLFDTLNEFAAPFFYFGSHPGDGSDYGFWLCEDFDQMLKDDDGIKVSDLSEVPTGFTGYVAQISDHGNVTLYACSRGRTREIWSVV